jgi:hypothetical protein
MWTPQRGRSRGAQPALNAEVGLAGSGPI